MTEIDHAYRKDTKHPQRWGYQLRGNAVPSSVIIHTTSNRRATRFETEAEYLQHSKDVSAHFLIGKDGRVTEFLDPLKYQAWHSGATLPAYLNARSIGIEHHVSVGEPWTAAQHEACTWLVRLLMDEYNIPPERIDTHRAVALPKGRKQDPAGWDDLSFYAWRASLHTSPPVSLPITRYRVKADMFWLEDRRADAPIANQGRAILRAGDVIAIDDVTNGWAHAQNSIGFTLMAGLEAV